VLVHTVSYKKWRGEKPIEGPLHPTIAAASPPPMSATIKDRTDHPVVQNAFRPVSSLSTTIIVAYGRNLGVDSTHRIVAL
jgi:hypothetical protein